MKSTLWATTLATALAVMAAVPALALDNGVARTPPMGWNSWNTFHCDVSAKLVEATADAMVVSGMRDAGYTYVNIDDCWLLKQRGPRGELLPDAKKFPQGIAAVADYVHRKGLKLGIYESAGATTCAGYPGSIGHEKQDAKTFASWGVDYLKYDNCGDYHGETYPRRYIAMRDALAASGRAIVYSICEWGNKDPWLWAPAIGNLWRATQDITPRWKTEQSKNHYPQGIMDILDQQAALSRSSHPGAWNDPDMLEVGNGYLTDAENRAHFSLWALLNPPLDCRQRSAQHVDGSDHGAHQSRGDRGGSGLGRPSGIQSEWRQAHPGLGQTHVGWFGGSDIAQPGLGPGGHRHDCRRRWRESQRQLHRS